MIPREQPQPQPPQTIPVLGRPHHHKLFGWSVLPPPIKRWRTNTQITTPHTSHTHTHTLGITPGSCKRKPPPKRRSVGRPRRSTVASSSTCGGRTRCGSSQLRSPHSYKWPSAERAITSATGGETKQVFSGAKRDGRSSMCIS